MGIEWLLAALGNIFEHRKAEGDVGNEHPVHNVEVEIVGIAIVEHVYVVVQPAEIGRKQRWRCEHSIYFLGFFLNN